MKDMNRSSVRYLLYAQACFYVGLIICVLLKPTGLTINGGISYYGIYKLTIIPYCLALLGAAYWCLRSAKGVTDQVIVFTLVSMSVLLVGLVITPDTGGRFIADAHVLCGSVLFIIQLLASGWLISRTQYDLWVIGWALIELAGGIASLIYLSPKNGYLLESQVVFQFSFGVLFFYSISKLWPEAWSDKQIVHEHSKSTT